VRIFDPRYGEWLMAAVELQPRLNRFCRAVGAASIGRRHFTELRDHS
jgi:hypothetical protein